MAKLSPQGPFRAFDADGAPLNGGKLYTYEAGTSTPKTTYTTESAVTPNANPVILDADGYANVWLGDGAYKLVLKNSADVTLWTIDNVVGDAASGFSSTVIDQGTNLNLSDAYANYFINCTAAITISLLSASSAGDGFYFIVKASSGDVVIDPNGAELIDGASTKTIASGLSALVVCNGSVWYTAFLTPAEFLDSTFRVVDSADTTKKLAFEVSGVTTGTTRTLTVPNASTTIVGTDATQTLTNKTLTAPVIASFVNGAATITSPATTGTLAIVSEVGIKLQTAVSATSGTSINLSTAIPATAKRITINFIGVSTNGNSMPLVQVGNGSFVTTGYLGGTTSSSVPSANAVITTLYTNGFNVSASGVVAVSQIRHGKIVLDLADSATNTWTATGIMALSDLAVVSTIAGSIALSGALDRVRLTTAGGVDTFDAGTVSISWEF